MKELTKDERREIINSRATGLASDAWLLTQKGKGKGKKKGKYAPEKAKKAKKP